jgi:chromosome segregation ATPase
MAAFEEILQLEQSISELQRDLPKVEHELSGMDKAIEHTREKVEEKLHVYTGTTANLKHLREVADHVVLEEWKALVIARDEAREDLIEARKALAKAEDRKRKLVAHVADMQRALAARRVALAEYGQVRPFATKG